MVRYIHPRSIPFSLSVIPDVRSSTSIGCPDEFPACFVAGLGLALFFCAGTIGCCCFFVCGACAATFALATGSVGLTFCTTPRAARASLRRATGAATGVGACWVCTTGFEEPALADLDFADTCGFADGCGWGFGGEGDGEGAEEEGAGAASTWTTGCAWVDSGDNAGAET